MYLRVYMKYSSPFLKYSRFFTWLAIAFMLHACTQSPAKIEVRQHPSQQKSDFSPARDINLITPYKINVSKGQTLYQIARENEVPIRDLIDLNRLKPPYNLMAGQQLKLPKPTYHLVRSGDTLSDIARGYDVNVMQLASVNRLQHPYNIRVGERLKVPGKQNHIAQTETAIDENETAPQLAYSRDVNSKPLPTPSARNGSTSVASNGSPIPTNRPTASASRSVSSAKTFTASNRQPHFNWPVKGDVISSFGPKKGGLQNDGINISAPEGASIQAAEEGVVVYAGNELKGYGNLLLIKHHGGYLSAYAHARDLLVSKGDAVAKGQKIATIGSTGHVDVPQLHFSIRKGRTAVNPVQYLSRQYSSR